MCLADGFVLTLIFGNVKYAKRYINSQVMLLSSITIVLIKIGTFIESRLIFTKKKRPEGRFFVV